MFFYCSPIYHSLWMFMNSRKWSWPGVEEAKVRDMEVRHSTSVPSGEGLEETGAHSQKPGAEEGVVLGLEQDERYMCSVYVFLR